MDNYLYAVKFGRRRLDQRIYDCTETGRSYLVEVKFYHWSMTRERKHHTGWSTRDTWPWTPWLSFLQPTRAARNTSQVWLADDATAEGFGGSGAVSKEVPRLPDHPTMHESRWRAGFGCKGRAHREGWKSQYNHHMTTQGKRHLGAAVVSLDLRDEFVSGFGKGEDLVHCNWDIIASTVALIHPLAAYVHGWTSKWSHRMHFNFHGVCNSWIYHVCGFLLFKFVDAGDNGVEIFAKELVN